jgi:dodecin
MTVASVTEISAISERGFEDAIRTAVDRATATLRGVEGCWVKDQNVTIEDGIITGYKVNLEVTFLLEEAAQGSAQGSAHDATGEKPQTGRTVPVEERPEAGGV